VLDLPEPQRTDKKPSSTKPLTSLKPGLSLKLVVNTNSIRETNDIRTSALQDISEGKLILAQTDPALSSRYLTQSIIISFLTEEKEKPVRYGFQARIIEFINEYPLSPSQTGPTIVVRPESDPERFNLRTFYRVHPTGEIGLQISINGQPVEVIDISMGGAIICLIRDYYHKVMFEIGKTIDIILTLNHQAFDLEAEIKRINLPDQQKWSRDVMFVALQFCDLTLELDRVLGEKIIEIQREQRSRGLDP
jgi:hypothetical protein